MYVCSMYVCMCLIKALAVLVVSDRIKHIIHYLYYLTPCYRTAEYPLLNVHTRRGKKPSLGDLLPGRGRRERWVYNKLNSVVSAQPGEREGDPNVRGKPASPRGVRVQNKKKKKGLFIEQRALGLFANCPRKFAFPDNLLKNIERPEIKIK